jgi:hypothetical protein
MRLVALSLLAVIIATPAVAKCGFFAGNDCYDDQYCRSIGTQRGTDVYAQCRLIQQQQRIQQQQNFNQMYQNLMPMVVPQAPAPPPMTTCRSFWYGGVLTTRCY